MKKILTFMMIVMIIPTIMLFTACNNGPTKPTTETKISQEEVAWASAAYKTASKVELLESVTEQQRTNFIVKYTSEQPTTEKTFEQLVAEYNQSVTENSYVLSKDHVVYIKDSQEYICIGMWSVYNNQICIWDAVGTYYLYTIVANSNNTGKKGFERETSVDNDCGVKKIQYFTFDKTFNMARYRF